ncbi:MAG: hypothetical protein ACM31C_08105 [Acidobacteriota bacterium]
MKLPAELKQRIRAVISGTDESVHAFMLKAIEHETALAEQRRGFADDARRAEADFDRTGLGYAADDVHAYVRARAAGKKPRRPKARSWRR